MIICSKSRKLSQRLFQNYRILQTKGIKCNVKKKTCRPTSLMCYRLYLRIYVFCVITNHTIHNVTCRAAMVTGGVQMECLVNIGKQDLIIIILVINCLLLFSTVELLINISIFHCNILQLYKNVQIKRMNKDTIIPHNILLSYELYFSANSNLRLSPVVPFCIQIREISATSSFQLISTNEHKVTSIFFKFLI